MLLVVGAVCLSLYFAIHANRVRAKATISFNTIYMPNPLEEKYEPSESVAVLMVTNVGTKPFKINSIAAFDKKLKQYYVMTPDYRNPHSIKPGHFFKESETGNFVFPEKDFVLNLNKVLNVNGVDKIIRRVKKLKFLLVTNLGENITVKPTDEFYKMYQEITEELLSKNPSKEA